MDAKDVINRAKNLREFEVQCTLPETFRFTGTVPFDMRITGDQVNVKVLAETHEEALARATEYLNG
jgi:hypothetical protein